MFAKMFSPVYFPFIVCSLATGWLASTVRESFALTVNLGFNFFFCGFFPAGNRRRRFNPCGYDVHTIGILTYSISGGFGIFPGGCGFLVWAWFLRWGCGVIFAWLLLFFCFYGIRVSKLFFRGLNRNFRGLVSVNK